MKITMLLIVAMLIAGVVDGMTVPSYAAESDMMIYSGGYTDKELTVILNVVGALICLAILYGGI